MKRFWLIFLMIIIVIAVFTAALIVFDIEPDSPIIPVMGIGLFVFFLVVFSVMQFGKKKTAHPLTIQGAIPMSAAQPDTQVMLIQLESYNDYELINKFTQFSLNKSKNYKFSRHFSIGLSLLFIIAGVAGLFSDTNRFGVPMIILGVVCLFLFIFPVLHTRRFKNSEWTQGKNTFLFYPDYVRCNHSGASVQSDAVIGYNLMDKVYELDDMFLLYMTNNQAYMMGKKYLKPDQADYLRQFFGQRFGEHFLNYTKNKAQ